MPLKSFSLVQRLCIGFLLIITGCASTLSDSSLAATATKILGQPEPKPNYLIRLDPNPGATGFSSDRICLAVDYYPLWEKGDSEETIVNTFKDRVTLILDGRYISLSSQIFSGPVAVVADTNGEIIGEIGMADLCYKVNLGDGIHLATFKILTSAKKQHEYSWAFSR